MLCYGGPIKLLAAVWLLHACSALLNRFRSLNLFSTLLPEIFISFEAATVIVFACFWNLVVFPCKMNFKPRVPGDSEVKNLPAMQKTRFDPWVGKIPWRVFLPGEFHEQRSLLGYSPWGHRVRYD